MKVGADLAADLDIMVPSNTPVENVRLTVRYVCAGRGERLVIVPSSSCGGDSVSCENKRV